MDVQRNLRKCQSALQWWRTSTLSNRIGDELRLWLIWDMPSVARINMLCYRQKMCNHRPPALTLFSPFHSYTRLLLTSSPSLPSPPALASTSRNEVILVWWETLSRQTKYAHTWAFYRLIRWPLAGCTAGSAPVLSSLCLQKLHRDWPFSPAPKYNFHSAYTRNVGGRGGTALCCIDFCLLYDSKGEFEY